MPLTGSRFVPTISTYTPNSSSSGGNINNDPENSQDIARLLNAWSEGDRDAAEKFMPLIYDELRRQAHRHLNRERPNHTLQTTALVHEAYLRLAEQNRVTWQNRSHFFALAAQMMRRILVNYAVGQKADKRGGDIALIPLDETIQIAVPDGDVDLIALDEALSRLEELDERQSRIVELRYFSGLSIEETADVLGISPATVKREWTMAKAWLRRELTAN